MRPSCASRLIVACSLAKRLNHAGIERAALWMIVVAALIRKGILPFHAWVPEVFDHGRLGPAILFSAPQLGAYVTVVLIVPRASPEVLRLMIGRLAAGAQPGGRRGVGVVRDRPGRADNHVQVRVAEDADHRRARLLAALLRRQPGSGTVPANPAASSIRNFPPDEPALGVGSPPAVRSGRS